MIKNNLYYSYFYEIKNEKIKKLFTSFIKNLHLWDNIMFENEVKHQNQ